MLYSYNWLKELAEKTPKPKKLMDTLTLHSVEVEEIDEGGLELGNVVVGQLLDHRKHPDADKLHIGIFDVGEEKPRQIIFGDIADLKVGNKIPVALSPTVLPGKFKIKERKLRGELSQGMCCLNSELGILDRKEEVHFFDQEIENGTPIVGVLPLGETVIDIDNKSMTHRSDLFNHVGLAQEIAAVYGGKVQLPKTVALPKKKTHFNISVEDEKACPRYMAVELHVQIGSTPDKIAKRLQVCGIKSINNVVDITNYVMLEMGQPMHAFDAEKIEGNKISVRFAKKGEKIITLDHEEKKLDETIQVIADEKKPIAIAGVIGGAASAVSEETTRIILESANFQALITRKGATTVHVRTESAMRFEKGLSPNLVEDAMMRAIHLLQEHAEATILGMNEHYPNPYKAEIVVLEHSFLTRISGHTFIANEVQKHLEALGCTVTTKKRSGDLLFYVTPPAWRMDLNIREDIVEEIIRLHGVNNIEEKQLTGVLEVPKKDIEIELMRTVRKVLAAQKQHEVYNYSFYGDETVQRMGWDAKKEHIEITNPLSEDLRYLRVNLLPRLLENIAKNQQGRDTFALFELGHVYFTDREVRQLGLVQYARKGSSYREMRGTIETLLQKLNIQSTSSIIHKNVPCEFWGMYESDQALRIDSGGEILGTIGQVDAAVLKAYDIEGTVSFSTFSIQQMAKQVSLTKKITPLSQFPAVLIDLSVIFDEKIEWGEIEQIIKEHGKKILRKLGVKDVYTGGKIPAGKKSISMSLTLQSDTRTLAMEEVEKWRDELMKKLSKKWSAELRAK